MLTLMIDGQAKRDPLLRASEPGKYELWASLLEGRKKRSERNILQQGEATRSPFEGIPKSETTTISKEDPQQLDHQLKPPRTTTQSNMVVIVMSARSHFRRRQVIRETWGSGHDNIYFAVGAPCRVPLHRRNDELGCDSHEPGESSRLTGELDHIPFRSGKLRLPPGWEDWEQQDKDYRKGTVREHEFLLEEQAINNDILWTDAPESYRSLPHKLRSSVIWLYKNIPHAQWFTKVDDDMIVRVGTLEKHLDKLVTKNDDSSKEATIVGDIKYDMLVQKEGQWADSNYTKRLTYPPWPKGSCGYALNRVVAKYVTLQNKDLFISQGEDTSLGIWMDESPFAENVNWIKSEVFNNLSRCSNPKYFVIGHNLSPERISFCFENFGDEIEQVEQKFRNFLYPTLLRVWVIFQLFAYLASLSVFFYSFRSYY